MSNDSSIIASQQVPVVDQDDVAAEWSEDVFDPANPPPIISAVQAGQTAMLLAYQSASAYAASQSDPARATDEYEDECGWERGVYRQTSEADPSYRARFFSQKTVDPADIIAAANAVLAPYTSTSCVYFEHSDAWFVRDDFLDIVGATNATPIVLTTRRVLPAYVRTGDQVTVSLVAGNTAANGTWTATVVMGPVVASNTGGASVPAVTLTGTPTTAAPIQISILGSGPLGTVAMNWTNGDGVFTLVELFGAVVVLGNTGLTANFSSGNYVADSLYSASPAGLALNGSTGNGAYTGSGSLLVPENDPSVNASQWSSHVFGVPYSTQNYPDRLYDQLPGRFSCGARAFSNPYGRIFWLVAPDISAIDVNWSPVYAGYLDVVGASNTAPIEITTRDPLPTGLVTGSSVTVSLVAGNTAANGTWGIVVTGPNSFTLVGTTGTGAYSGSGSVQTYLTLVPQDGFFAGAGVDLPGQVLVPAGGSGTLTGANTVALVTTAAGMSETVTLASPTTGLQQAILDTAGFGAQSPITVNSGGAPIEDPQNPGNFTTALVLTTNFISAFWIWTGSEWSLYGQNSSYVWSISATSFDVYSALVSAVESIRGQSIRWWFWADPNLTN